MALGLYRLADGTGYPPDAWRAVRLLTMTTDLSPGILGQGFPVAWTLPVELIFYASLPVLSAVAARMRLLTGWQAALLPPVVLLGLGLATRLALHHGPLATSSYYWVIETSFLTQCDMFAWGMLAAIAAPAIDRHGLRLPAHWRRVAVPAAVVVLVLCAARLGTENELTRSYANSVAAAAMGVLLAAVVLPHPVASPRVVRVLEWRPLVFVGIVSYSVYLWHSPVLDWMVGHGLVHGGVAGLAVTIAIALVVTLVIASASYAFVEAPALRHKHVMSRGRTAAGPAPDRAPDPAGTRPPSPGDAGAEPASAARPAR
jgi:peptidoglycan/LPS O-acetylase OafA/YrhL